MLIQLVLWGAIHTQPLKQDKQKGDNNNGKNRKYKDKRGNF